MTSDEEDKVPKKVTDIEAIQSNVATAVENFNERWISVPNFTEYCTIMDIRQLRNAMGLRSTMEAGDPWPLAEQMLLNFGFHWHWVGGTRVMFLQEKENFQPDVGWEDGEEIE